MFPVLLCDVLGAMFNVNEFWVSIAICVRDSISEIEAPENLVPPP